LEPAAGVPVSVTAATEVALWELAGRWHGLDGELARLDELLDALVRKVAPDLLALPGVGTETAAALLEAAGDNPAGWSARPRSRTCTAPRRCRPPRARPCRIASTRVGTATPTRRCGT